MRVMRYERCALYIDKTLKWTGDEFRIFFRKTFEKLLIYIFLVTVRQISKYDFNE